MDYYTQSGRSSVVFGDIFELETSLPLDRFDIPDFIGSGDRTSTNALYNHKTNNGSYYVDIFKNPFDTGIQEAKESLGVNSVWKTDWKKSERLHDLYTWDSIDFSGSAEARALVEVTGLNYSGNVEGVVTGGYIQSENSSFSNFEFTGKSLVLVATPTGSQTYSNYVRDFLYGVRGQVGLRPLCNPHLESGFIDASDETGRSFLSGSFLDDLSNSTGDRTNIPWEGFLSGIDDLNTADKKIFLVREFDSSDYSFQTLVDKSESDTVSEIRNQQINVYDFYISSENSAESNPLKSVTSYFYPQDSLVSGNQNILWNGVMETFIQPLDAIFFNGSDYRFIGNGNLLGNLTGTLGGVENYISEENYLEADIFPVNYKDQLLGNLDLSVSGNINFKDYFEENGLYYCDISGQNFGPGNVTGNFKGVGSFTAKTKSSNFDNFVFQKELNLSGFVYSGTNAYDNVINLFNLNEDSMKPYITDSTFLSNGLKNSNLFDIGLQDGYIYGYADELIELYTGDISTAGGEYDYKNELYPIQTVSNEGDKLSKAIIELDNLNLLNSNTLLNIFSNKDRTFYNEGVSVDMNSSGDRIVIGAPEFSQELGLDFNFAGYAKVLEWDGSSWFQLGGDIEGDIEESFNGVRFGEGVALNSTGSRVAVSTRSRNYTRVLEWDGLSWVQLGSDISKGSKYVSFDSLGNRISVGGRSSNSPSKIYEWNGSSWIEIFSEFYGRQTDFSSNGNVVAIGKDILGGSRAEKLIIKEWDGSSWVQLGDDINVTFFDLSINSDGYRVAVSVNRGSKVYEWDGLSWVQLGSDFGDLEFEHININSDGDIVSMSSPRDKISASIYEWDGSSWVQLGDDISEEASAPGALNQNWDLSLNSDGNKIVVGSPEYFFNGINNYRGRVKVYEWNGSDWIQFGIKNLSENHNSSEASIQQSIGILNSYGITPHLHGSISSQDSRFNDVNIVQMGGFSTSDSPFPNKNYQNNINFESKLVSGYANSAGEIVPVTGSNLNFTANTGISGEFNFFDIDFLTGEKQYFIQTNGERDLSSEQFYTYAQSTGSGYFETYVFNTPVFPIDFPKEIYFEKSFDPFFSRSISGNWVVSGITEENYEDIASQDINITAPNSAVASGYANITGNVEGNYLYTGIYYFDQDVVNPAYDFNYKTSGTSNLSIVNLSTGDITNARIPPSDPAYNDNITLLNILDISTGTSAVGSSVSTELFFGDAQKSTTIYMPPESKYVEKIEVRVVDSDAAFPVDDDISIFINDIPAVNPRRNAGWYDITGYSWIYSGAIYPEDKVEVAVFDGWGGAGHYSEWTADLFWNDGLIQNVSGGYSSIASSIGIPTSSELGISSSQYYSPTGGGPWAENYLFYTGDAGKISIDRDEEEFIVQDCLYVEYNTFGIQEKIAKGLGFNVRLSENRSIPNEEYFPPTVSWENVGFTCNLDFLKKNNEKEEEGEEESENPCDPSPFCGEDVPSDGGSSDAGGENGAGRGSSTATFPFYSGAIFINRPKNGDYIDFSPYNFDYSDLYESQYGTGFPSNKILDKRFFFSEFSDGVNTFNTSSQLSSLLNSHFNTFSYAKSGIWEWHKTELPEYSGSLSGDFFNKPLLKATALNKNIVEVKSLIYGEIGNYKIEVGNIQSGLNESSRLQYSLPRSVALQGSDNRDRWKTIMKKDFDSNENTHEILSGYQIESTNNIAENFSYIQVENDIGGNDLLRIQAQDSFVSSGGQTIDDTFISNVNLSSVGINPFSDTSPPSSGINITDFFSNQIQVNYSGASNGVLLGEISGYEYINPNKKVDLEDLINSEFLKECPKPKAYTRTKTTVVDSGFDNLGNFFTITSDETTECSGCDGYNLTEVPPNHPVNSGISEDDPDFLVSGWVECPSEDDLEDLLKGLQPKKERVSLLYSGFFTGSSGDSFFNSNNSYFEGSVNYSPESKPIYQTQKETGEIAIYEFLDQTINFGEVSIQNVPTGYLQQNSFENSIISYRTGFLLENEKEYNYYRFLFSGYDTLQPLDDHSIQDGIVVFDEINLYGPTQYVYDLSGSQEVTLYDATYSGDLEVFATGRITGSHSGQSISGILPINEFKTGDLVNDLFYNGEQIYPTQPFGTRYKTSLTGIGEASETVTGIFYNTQTNTLYSEITFSKTVTGNEIVDSGINRVNGVSDIINTTNELVYIDIESNARFSGLGEVEVFQSGIPSFVNFTGSETGFINSGSGEFAFDISNSGLFSEVYSLEPTGYANASAYLNYNSPAINDSVRIGNQNFTFGKTTQPPDKFNNITGLVSIINSGDFNYSALLDGTSGVALTSSLLGSGGNITPVTSTGSTGSPFFDSTTFTGGQNLYQQISGYDIFTGNLSAIVENTGVYSVDYSGDISGLVNIFTGTRYFTDAWKLYTGKYNKDYDFLSGIPSGSEQTGKYEGNYHNFGSFPGQFSTFIEYKVSGKSPTEQDVAELIITGNNLTGYRVRFFGGQ